MYYDPKSVTSTKAIVKEFTATDMFDGTNTDREDITQFIQSQCRTDRDTAERMTESVWRSLCKKRNNRR